VLRGVHVSGRGGLHRDGSHRMITDPAVLIPMVGGVGAALAFGIGATLHSRASRTPDAVRHEAILAAVATRGWRADLTTDALYRAVMARALPGLVIDITAQPASATVHATVTDLPRTAIEARPACHGRLTLHENGSTTCQGGRDDCWPALPGVSYRHRGEPVACASLSHGCGQCQSTGTPR
jgi:hypothetical protein